MKKIYIIALHLGYWLLMILLLIVLYIATQVGSPNGPSPVNLSLLIFGFIFLPSIVSFYGSYFILFQQYIQKAKKSKFIFYTFSVVIIASLFALLNVFIKTSSTNAFLQILFVSFILNSFSALVGFIMHSFISWFTDIKVKEELTNKTKMLELEMLKLKLDPHFLFNTINNIDVLIESEPNKASEYIIKLSSLLRFYLYKTAQERIKLSDEIKYIQEYIDLQKIRTSNEDFIEFILNGKPENKEIAPMIFIPFIENAFKHSQNKKTGLINIQIDILKDEIRFKCMNKMNVSEHKENGIGNKLIEHRLNLLFGNQYDLNVTNTDDDYIVDLKIPT